MALIEINWRPERRQLRTFGLVCFLAFALLGAWARWHHAVVVFRLGEGASHAVARGLWGASLVCLALALVVPTWLRPLHVGLCVIALPIGLVVSHVLLALVFYGVFTPVAVAFRLLGRDALCRRFDRDAETYWLRRRSTGEVRRYFRQS
jgi:hypothetical protein